MTQDLITTFGKSDGGTYDWKYKGLDPDLSASEIKNACELLTKLDICTKNGVKLFDSVITAKVVTTKETLVFDPEHETTGVNYYGETVEKTVEEPTCEEVGCFKVADEPKEATDAKHVHLTSPSLPLMEAAKKPYERPVKHLVNTEDTKASIKIEKDTFPQVKLEHQIAEKHDLNTSQPQEPHPAIPSTPKKGWFKRLFKRKSRNKEDPESPPNEPISRE